MSEEHYFPGLSERTQNLNQILEGLYNFKTKPFTDNQESLNQIAQNLEETDSNLQKLGPYNYSTDTTNQIKDQVNNYSEQFDIYLTNLISDKESELENILSSIDSAKNNLTILQTLRQKVNSIEEYINSNQGIRETLVLRDIESSEIFSNYSNKREQIKTIDEEISLLTERYDSFFDSNNPKKELKDLLKTTKTKSLFKTEIYKNCKQAGYYEGIILLDNLHKNVKLLLSNKSEYNFLIAYQRNLTNRNRLNLKEKSIVNINTQSFEEEKQKTYNTQYRTETITANQRFSYLHALIQTLGYPKDYHYFKLRDTLNGKYSSNWLERLYQFSSELDKLELTKSGRIYISEIAQCLEIAQEQGQYVDEIDSARTAIRLKLTA
ncbi:MAG: hypothetical protein KAQ83_03215 [Nanoarchaeota archaeon]|nr:hypothetical protein [Nanoarchaeota archaeon]